VPLEVLAVVRRAAIRVDFLAKRDKRRIRRVHTAGPRTCTNQNAPTAMRAATNPAAIGRTCVIFVIASKAAIRFGRDVNRGISTRITIVLHRGRGGPEPKISQGSPPQDAIEVSITTADAAVRSRGRCALEPTIHLRADSPGQPAGSG
jgi:hypothetical protein